MKKKVLLGLAGMMMLSLAGCGKSKYLLDVDYTDYVTLCDYKGVEADKVVFDVTDEEVSEKIDMEMYDYATYDEVTDRGIENGDYVVIDYDSKLDGKESEEYSGEEEEIMVGEEYFFPEVEEALIGLKKGDKKSVEFTLTEDFAEEGDVGKTISMDVTVGDVTVEHLPEYNEEFVKENTDYDSVEAYNAAVKQELMDSKEEEYKSAAVSDILQFIVSNSEFNGYPDDLYKQCEEYYDAENENYASMYGMEVDEFLDMMGVDEDTRKQEIEESVNYELVVGAIAQKEHLDCSEDEVEKFVEDNYAEYGYESAEDFYADYSKQDIGYQLLYEKVLDYLYDNAKYVEIDEDTYLKEQEEAQSDEDAQIEEDAEDEEDAGTDEEEAGDDESLESEEKNSSEESSEETSEEATSENAGDKNE